MIRKERSWLASTSPSSLLLALKGKRRPRQRRLIAVACCRRMLDRMPHPDCQRAVEVGERFADGTATAKELESAYRDAQSLAQALFVCCQRPPPGKAEVLWEAWRLAYAAQLCAARSGPEEATFELLKRAGGQGPEKEAQEKVEQSQLIRDILGNPFRPLPTLDPDWLSWNDGAVVKVAQTSYEERGAGLTVLGDALEEAGCTDRALLDHCRSSTLHARGCWVLDLILSHPAC